MGGESGGLRIVFDPALDGGGWPGALSDRAAVVGEAWLGPLGLLDRLETELGLGGLWATGLERAADLAVRLRGRDGFFRASLDADPLATCRRLLADRDTLRLWGWRGQAAGERLATLWEAGAEALPGIPDRLDAVVPALAERDVDIEVIETAAAPGELEPAWQAVFEALEKRGVKLSARSTPPTHPSRLQLFRPHGPLAAADELAAALAARGDLRGVVIIGGDAALDAALARHGLPRTGGSALAPGSTALPRLVLEAAFTPMDPSHLHALLCLDPGPVPRVVASKLCRALSSLPGRGSDDWRTALAEGLGRLDEGRRGPVEERLAILLQPAAGRDESLAIDEIERRLAAITTWAQARAESIPSLRAAAYGAAAILRHIELVGADALTHAELGRICDDVLGESSLAAPSEAGLAHVSRPGAILGPAELVVWWNFTRGGAPLVPRLRLSPIERRALSDAGVTPPDLGALAAAAARRWRRPLDHAASTLLVCPQRDAAGEPAFPHPLWDELATELDTSSIETRALALPRAAPRKIAELRCLPAPTPTVAAPALALRKTESPSSLEKLLGCSLSWALQYRGNLRGGLSSGPAAPPSPLLYGNLAHHLLAQVFEGGALSPDAARARAEAGFDAEVDRVCESLGLPRFQVERATLRQAVVESAAHLAEIIAAAGASVEATEIQGTAELAGVTVAGTADMILRGPDAVIDLKWGKSANHDKLRSDSALQLAIYAELFARDGARPAIAYYILRTQQIFGEPGSPLPEASAPGNADAAAMWRGASSSLAVRLGELGRGELLAPGNFDDVPRASLDPGGLTLAPPCKYCDHGALCGRNGTP